MWALIPRNQTHRRERDRRIRATVPAASCARGTVGSSAVGYEPGEPGPQGCRRSRDSSPKEVDVVPGFEGESRTERRSGLRKLQLSMCSQASSTCQICEGEAWGPRAGVGLCGFKSEQCNEGCGRLFPNGRRADVESDPRSTSKALFAKSVPVWQKAPIQSNAPRCDVELSQRPNPNNIATDDWGAPSY